MLHFQIFPSPGAGEKFSAAMCSGGPATPAGPTGAGPSRRPPAGGGPPPGRRGPSRCGWPGARRPPWGGSGLAASPRGLGMGEGGSNGSDGVDKGSLFFFNAGSCRRGFLTLPRSQPPTGSQIPSATPEGRGTVYPRPHFSPQKTHTRPSTLRSTTHT